jgi:FkbM family methyltransferase
MVAEPASRSALADAENVYRRLKWVLKVRPQPLAVLLGNAVGGINRRRLVELPNGIAYHLDPLTQFASRWFELGAYERETEAIFRAEIEPDDIVVDVGANEGYFTILAAQLAYRGRVIAVEPQARCVDAINRNLAANDIRNCTILPVALGQSSGKGQLLLMPEMNNGASSLVRSYRWSRRKQPVEIIDADELAARIGVQVFDFVKIDVEGYEPEVVRGLLPLLRAGRVKKLLLDYHPTLLAPRGIRPEDIHEQIVTSGMQGVLNKDGYTLYRVAN